MTDLSKETRIVLRLFLANYKENGLMNTPEYVRAIKLLKKLKEIKK